MGSHMIDSFLFQHVVSTDDMREVWDEKTNVQRLLDVEAALAKAEAKLGIIPQDAAEEICRKAKYEYIKMEDVRAGIRKSGHSLVPLIKSLEKACEGDFGQYIHYGATTQDVRDTAMMTQIKDARAPTSPAIPACLSLKGSRWTSAGHLPGASSISHMTFAAS